MLPTPSTSHIDINKIYEPAEDSYLLLDTLSSATEIEFLRRRFCSLGHANGTMAAPLMLEIGTGSGVVLAFLSAHAKTIFGTSNVLAIGTDINRFACSASAKTVQQTCRSAPIDGTQDNGLRGQAQLLTILNADLSTPFRSGEVDVLIFNPPYVPSTKVPMALPSVSDASTFEHDSHLLSLSYEGGRDGMEVTNRFLAQLPYVLNQTRGVAYTVLCQQNHPEKVIERILEWSSDWSVDIVGRSGSRAGWEKLVVIRISRNKHDR